MLKALFLFILFASSLKGVEYQSLNSYLQPHPFSYDLGLLTIEGKSPDADVLLCCHGYTGDERIGAIVNSYGFIADHVVSFRFPDYGNFAISRSPQLLSYGTIQELLPFLYLVKKICVDGGAHRINLYGYSAGGGAIVNTLAVLVEQRYTHELEQIGIGPEERQTILSAIQNGFVILECPLKSLDEICACRGSFGSLEIMRERYEINRLRPIDSLRSLASLKLRVLVYFEDPDEILSNRDDELYMERLFEANRGGESHIVTSSEGGHLVFHAPLWKTYTRLKKQNM